MTRRVWPGLTVAAILTVLLAGCGVPLQDAATPLPSEVVAVPTSSPSPSTSPTAQPTVEPSASPTPSPLVEIVDEFFVRDDGLVAVETELAVPVIAEYVVDALVLGPPEETGLRSVAVDPLTGTPLIAISAVGPEGITGASVTVTLAAQFSALPPNEQVLLLGQVVLSLSSAGWPSVAFVDALGSPVAVPLPDGRVLDRPAVAGDYAGLIVEL